MGLDLREFVLHVVRVHGADLVARGRAEHFDDFHELVDTRLAGEERLAETLTIGRLGVPPTLARTLRSTNSIESMIEICRDHAANVKRWQDGQMVLRWVAAGMGEAAKQFRRVNGYLHLPALRAALDQSIAAVTPTKEDAA